MKRLCIVCSIILLFIVLLVSGNKYRKRAEIAERNVVVLTSGLDSIKTRNGELAIEREALQIDYNSLKQVNSELSNEIKNLRLKSKDVQHISEIKEIVRVEKDTIIVPDKNGNYKIKDPNIVANILIKNDTLKHFDCTLPNKMYMVVSTIHKGWWIFRKKVGVKITLKNTNKYYNIDGVYSYQLK